MGSTHAQDQMGYASIEPAQMVEDQPESAQLIEACMTKEAAALACNATRTDLGLTEMWHYGVHWGLLRVLHTVSTDDLTIQQTEDGQQTATGNVKKACRTIAKQPPLTPQSSCQTSDHDPKLQCPSKGGSLSHQLHDIEATLSATPRLAP